MPATGRGGLVRVRGGASPVHWKTWMILSAQAIQPPVIIVNARAAVLWGEGNPMLKAMGDPSLKGPRPRKIKGPHSSYEPSNSPAR